MDGFDPKTSFGAAVAADYDEIPRGDEAETVDLMAELAGGRTALEFAIGTGRIAVPLSERGVEVTGIELSPEMLAVLKGRSSTITTFQGDMTTVETGRTYPLVYLVFNTIFNLLTQDDQIRCFANAAKHLEPGGVFLVETAVPSAWVRRSNYIDAERVGTDFVVLDVCRYDAVTQILDENHVRLDASGIRLQPISARLAWPSELDLMARIAGLRLIDRWSGWKREPFTGDSTRHVSIYGR